MEQVYSFDVGGALIDEEKVTLNTDRHEVH